MGFTINVDGNIGAGKTHITNAIKCILEKNGINVFLIDEEFVNTKKGLKILGKYYDNRKKYSYKFNKYILVSLSKRIKILIKELKHKNEFLVIFDRSIITNFHVFIKMNYEEGNINKRQHNKLLKIYESLYFRYITLELGICENNHYFYIRESVDELLNRITQRGRESERNIKSSFLKKVECYHEKLFMREVELPYSIHDKNDITIINENEDKLSIILKKLGKLFNKYFL